MPTVPLHWLAARGYDVGSLREFSPETTDRAGRPALAIPAGDARWRAMVDARNRNRPAKPVAAMLARAGPARHATPTRDTACVHRGPEAGTRPCRTCGGGNVQVKTFACGLHGGECSISRDVGVRVCARCPDMTAPAVPAQP